MALVRLRETYEYSRLNTLKAKGARRPPDYCWSNGLPDGRHCANSSCFDSESKFKLTEARAAVISFKLHELNFHWQEI